MGCSAPTFAAVYRGFEKEQVNKTMPVMKTKTLALWTGLVFGSMHSASSVPVTFQVNMDYQINATATFVPATGTVTCRGSFNNWGTGFVLTNSLGNTNLYQGTIDIAGTAGTVIEYKFVYDNNDTQGAHWETVGTPNRYFKLGDAPLVLPIAYYGDVWWGGTTVDISFKLDMSAQIGAGNFNPATDLVEVRGSFNGWASGTTMTNDPAQPHLYSGTYTEAEMPPGAIREYKFVYVDIGYQAHWESLPSHFRENRSFIVPTANLELPVVYFSDASGFPIKAAVYFQLDMSAQAVIGSFDPATDQPWVRGNTLGWGNPPEGLQLVEDTSRPGIYTNLYLMNSQLTGAPIEYKQVIYRTDTSEVVWEGGGNKSLSFKGDEPTNSTGYHVITVGPVYFDGVSPSEFLPADTLVTFRVDMNNARRYGGAAFNPPTESVWINGDVLPGGWNAYGFWDTKPAETLMYDDGATAGDTMAGDRIYSWQIQINKGARVRVQYKYGIESGDNEAPSGQDHVRYVRGTGTWIMPIDTFGTQYQEPSFGDLTIAPPVAGKVQVSWLGRPGVHLQTATDLTGDNWVNHPATDGLSSTNFPAGDSATFFRLINP